MKCMYWRPRKVSRWTIVGISLFAVVGLVLVESLGTARPAPHREAKLEAAGLAQRMLRAIKAEKLRRGHRIYKRLDPTESGLIGRTASPITTLPAKPESKQAAVNPNLAAAVLQDLIDAGVQSGDTVAVGYSGSFPGLNVAVCAALEALQVRPIVIASAASSQFGANEPDFMWLDMEQLLHQQGLISFRSVAASPGGPGDRLLGHSDEAHKMFDDCVVRTDVTPLQPKNLLDAIDQRMAIFERIAGDDPIQAYINVGGGAASVRGSQGKEVYLLGLNQDVSAEALEVDCVMSRFAGMGIDVVHLAQADKLARKLGMDIETAAVLGAGPLFQKSGPNRWLAAVFLVGLLCLMRVNILTDGMYRLKQLVVRRSPESPDGLHLVRDSKDAPQLMV